MSPTPTIIDRREMLLLTLASAAAAALPGTAAAADGPMHAPAGRFAALLADFGEQMLRLEPEAATTLGLDQGERAALKSRLDDASPAGDQRWAELAGSMLARLSKIDPEQLAPADRARYESVRYAAVAGIEGTRLYCGRARAAFADNEVAPYPVTQQNGALVSIPEFLDSQHQIANAADAEAYLARVSALAHVLDQESARIGEQAAHGVMPPSFIASNALGLLTDYRRTPVARQKLVTSLVTRTQALGIKGEWETRASALMRSRVYPALDRQIAAFARATANAPDTPGVDRLPEGAAYYRWALKIGTTTDMSAADIHAIGLEQNQAIKARMDGILKAQGMSQGSVGERVQALNSDARQLLPDTDQGRAALLDYCNDRVAANRALLPRLSHLGLKAPLIVKRVPVDIQDGAPLAYMNPGSLDGTRPSTYYINLKSTLLWPKFVIPSMSAHEGIPGHVWQSAYLAEHHAQMPLLASLLGFNAFIEGWALYAEQLADESGLYLDDPFGQIGYLQAQQFRACRMVVDTGLHAMKWTRTQAIEFMVAETGKGRDYATSEIDRYCASPGQACGYKVGHNEILRQRERARTALGARFDLAGFNDALVKTGGVPLALLGAAVDQFIAAP